MKQAILIFGLLLIPFFGITTVSYVDTYEEEYACQLLSISTIVSADTLQICANDFVLINGQAINTAGIYQEVLIGSTGQDSLVNVVVEVFPLYRDTILVNSCTSSAFVGNYFLESPGVHIDQLQSTHGCDSIVVAILKLLPNYSHSSQLQICEGDSIFLANAWQSQPGIYVDSLQSIDGCDSIRSIDLSFTTLFETDLDLSICNGDSLEFHGTTYTNGATFALNLVTDSGCDSIVNVSICIHPTNEEYAFHQHCEGLPINIDGTIYTESTTLRDTVWSEYNCPFVTVTELNFWPRYIDSVYLGFCPGETININGLEIGYPGVQWMQFLTTQGCDSIVYYFIEEYPQEYEVVEYEFCPGDTLLINNIAHTSEGFSINNFTNQFGCDSTEVSVLVIPETVTVYEQLEMCIGDSVFLAGSWRTEAGTYSELFDNAIGCDTILSIELSIVDLVTKDFHYTICPSDSLLIAGVYQQEPGLYLDTILNPDGCTIYEFHTLELHPHSVVEWTESICDGETYAYNNIEYQTAGIYEHLFTSIYGCDSLNLIHLEVLSNADTTLFARFCENESFEIGTSTFNQAGTYEINFSSSNGCDSLITLNLEIDSLMQTTFDTTICPGETYTWNSTNYTESGVYSDTFTGISGCDSIVTFNLNLFDPQVTLTQISICPHETAFLGGAEQTVPGTYIDSYTNIQGCDSIVHTLLNIEHEFYTSEVLHICAGDSILIAGNFETQVGLYFDTLTAGNGCDSILGIEVNIYQHILDTIDLQLCQGQGAWIHGNFETSSGLFTDTLLSANDCDSISIVNLEILLPPETNLDSTICASDSIFFADEFQTTPGIYFDTITTPEGCDSILTLVLDVFPVLETVLDTTLCAGDSLIVGTEIYTASGSYTHTYTTELCDSLFTINLIILDQNVTEIALFICPGDSVLIEDEYLFEIGNYTYSYPASTACDSTIIYSLTVLEAYEELVELQLCEGDSILIGAAFYKSDTLLYFNHQTYNGCDSLEMVELTVLPSWEIFAEDAEICSGASVDLFVEGAINEVTWHPSTGLSCTTCPNPVANPTHTTNYTVSSLGCMGEMLTQEVTVTVNFPPVIDLFGPQIIHLGDSILLELTTSENFSTTTIFNIYGDTLCINCAQIFATPNSDMTYYGSAINEAGCEAIDELNVFITEKSKCEKLFTPNIITPNGDGINDVFEVTSEEGVKELRLLRIYDRWGKLVFETNHIDDEKWDGTFLGKHLNPGVYVYYIEGVCLNEITFTHTGNITIIR